MQLLVFSAPWCHPCKVIKPILEGLSIKTIHIDVDKNPEISAHHQVGSIPTLILMDGTTEVRRHLGIISKEKLEQFLEV